MRLLNIKKSIYILSVLSVWLLFSCAKDENNEPVTATDRVEIALSVQDFTVQKPSLSAQLKSVSAPAKPSLSTRATTPASEAENQISNVYIFLFDPTGTKQVITYYSGGTGGNAAGALDANAKKVTVNKTQTEVGKRQIYVVANCNATLKIKLDGVTTLAGLDAIFDEISTPWSTTIATPLLMVGSTTYDFTAGYQLKTVPLARAVAKLQLNIILTTTHQSAPTIQQGVPGSLTEVYQYKYKFLNFDKNTYVVKPSTKTDALASFTDWVNWAATGNVVSYTLTDGKVTGLALVTYLNERDVAGATVEISLPYNAGGTLPPPEFGGETYKLQLPAAIVRNNWYVYDIEI